MRSIRSRRAGVSLVEVVVVASILTVLTKALIESATSMSQVTSSGNTQALLQEQGQEALRAIIADLSRSGFKDVNGKTFPHVFDDAEAFDPDFAAHTHALPNQEAAAGDPDFGPLREIVLTMPADLDGDGRPDLDLDFDGTPELDGNGDGNRTDDAGDVGGLWDPAQNTIDPDTGLVWSHDEISYIVNTRPDGFNYLERRVDADPGTARRVARDVERIQIDTPATSAWAIPLGTVRVRVFLRRRDGGGHLYRHRAEVVVNLRNGG